MRVGFLVEGGGDVRQGEQHPDTVRPCRPRSHHRARECGHTGHLWKDPTPTTSPARTRRVPDSPRPRAPRKDVRPARPWRLSDVPARRPDGRRRLRGGGGGRPDRAAVLEHADPAAPRAVREHRPLPAARDQPLRRARTGLVLEQHHHRRAHRHALRRAQPLGHRPGPDRHQPGPAGAARRAGRRHRPQRRVGRRPRLPARDRPRAGVGVRSTARSPRAAGCSTAPAGTPAPTARRRRSTSPRPGRTAPASRSSAPSGWPSPRRSWAWAPRRSAPTPAPRTRSPRRSRATASCSAPGSTASPSCATSTGCRRPAR